MAHLVTVRADMLADIGVYSHVIVEEVHELEALHTVATLERPVSRVDERLVFLQHASEAKRLGAFVTLVRLVPCHKCSTSSFMFMSSL